MNYTVAVRSLCEFTARRGDLDLRFTPGPSALEGMEGHAAVRSKRPPTYRAEISLAADYRNLHVRGRADGYDPDLNRLEEIKTYRGKLEAMPANHRALHWAQAKIYAYLLCRQLQLNRIAVALVYFDIGERTETLIVEDHEAASLEQHFQQHCDCFIDWADQEMRHRLARDAGLDAMSFPFPAFRPGQRDLSVSVYKSARQGRHLLAQAPTGIGKTAGTLFPVLKACPREGIDKLFYLTAKTSGRQLALDALARLSAKPQNSANTGIRVLELTARDKACEHPDKQCNGASCPLAQGFYDKLPAARQEAVDLAFLDKTALRAVGQRHQLCPYWLTQELAKWSDVVVGDYNYYFDTTAMLYSQTVNNAWRVTVLADEAHNLIERARKMYSAELDESCLLAAQLSAPPSLKTALTSLLKAWRKSYRDQESLYQVYDGIPKALHNALLRASGIVGDYLADHQSATDTALQTLYFDMLHFLRLAEVFASHSIFDITLLPRSDKRPSSARLCLRNMVPAPFLEPRFAAAHHAVLFSATLSPCTFYRDTLGMPEDAAWVDVDTPFRAEQLRVIVQRQISTRYQHRSQSIAPITALMARQYRHHPGNYLSYFSSFDYLSQVMDEFARSYPEIPIWDQSRAMQETDKDAFLQRFQEDGCGIGFAVLGGAFAEGIDLPGRKLIGAFVSTLGLPQMNPVNEALKDSMGSIFGSRHAYDYAYLYPGLQKVVQAAGRVIRTDTDVGVVHLIDDRYAQARVRRLFPRWWRVEYADQTMDEGVLIS